MESGNYNRYPVVIRPVFIHDHPAPHRPSRRAMRQKIARGSTRPGSMNATEVRYGEILRLRQYAGEVIWYAYEGIKLRLADKTFYTPDFAVMLTSGEMEMHEVKGFMRDDAAVKLKVAAQMYPFRFRLCRLKNKQWQITEI